MLQRLLHALIETRNEAADDLLLEALALGNQQEQQIALDALMRRGTLRGLSGVIACFEQLAEPLAPLVLQQIKRFHAGIRECARSEDRQRRLPALRLIAQARQGKLAYVLAENIHDTDEDVAATASEALLDLARWVVNETRRLQSSEFSVLSSQLETELRTQNSELRTYRNLLEQRPEIEQVVARAIDVHRGRFGGELLGAALLLCHHPGSKTLAILQTAKHGGQAPMMRRLQQPPTATEADAFLLAATHGGVRSQFGTIFSHVAEPTVLGAFLRKTHWLKDHQLQLCMHQVNRSAWLVAADLERDALARSPAEAASIGEWVAACGVTDVLQDELMAKLLGRCKDELEARLRLLRIVARRPPGSSLKLLEMLLGDASETLLRMTVRHILRRRPAGYETLLLARVAGFPPSVRRLISRTLGQSTFDKYWARFERLDHATRRADGAAMLSGLPEAAARLSRLLTSGPLQQRLKAMQVAEELELAAQMRAALVQVTADPNPRLRSRAVQLLGSIPEAVSAALLGRMLNDPDPRVRANAIEMLENQKDPSHIPLLTQLARDASARERANAIKALHRLGVASASADLAAMLADERAEHRISALWALRQIGWWQMLQEVGKLATGDQNMRVRRYALGVLRSVMEASEKQKAKAG